MTKTSPNTNWPTYHKMILETDYILFFRDEFLDAQLFGLLPEEVFQFVCYLVILAFLVIVDSAVRENLQHVRHELAWKNNLILIYYHNNMNSPEIIVLLRILFLY